MDRKEFRIEIAKAVATAIAIVILAALGQLVVGCSPRVYPAAEVRDSTQVIIRERLVHDTAFVEIPMIKEVNVTRDSSSHLENQYASSDASIVDGLLYHSLQTKPQKLAAPVDVPVSDTVYVHEKAQTITKEVPAQFTKWQSFQIIMGRILMLMVVAFLIYAAIILFVKR